MYFSKKLNLRLIIIALIIVCISLVFFCSCMDSTFPDYSCQALFNHLCNVVKTKDHININKVKAYSYNYEYFYEVEYSFFSEFEKRWTSSLKKVIIFDDTLFNVQFNIETDKDNFPYYYDLYLKAKAEGKSKVFTDAEINTYVDNYFNSKSTK